MVEAGLQFLWFYAFWPMISWSSDLCVVLKVMVKSTLGEGGGKSWVVDFLPVPARGALAMAGRNTVQDQHSCCNHWKTGVHICLISVKCHCVWGIHSTCMDTCYLLVKWFSYGSLIYQIWHFILISWLCSGQLKLGASLFRTEVVSLEIKVVSGD